MTIKQLISRQKAKQHTKIEAIAKSEAVRAFNIDFTEDKSAVIKFRGVEVFSGQDYNTTVETLLKLRIAYVRDCLNKGNIM